LIINLAKRKLFRIIINPKPLEQLDEKDSRGIERYNKEIFIIKSSLNQLLAYYNNRPVKCSELGHLYYADDVLYNLDKKKP